MASGPVIYLRVYAMKMANIIAEMYSKDLYGK
jgi:hypothetical protein